MTSHDPDQGDSFASGHRPQLEEPIRNSTGETRGLSSATQGEASLVLDEVVGDVVYVRQPDPGDDTSQRICLEPGQVVVVESPIAAISLHPTDQVGANDMVFSLRVGTRKARAGRHLRGGHFDATRRTTAAASSTSDPANSSRWHRGSVSIALDAIDDYYLKRRSRAARGQLPPALRVWFGMTSDVPAETLRLAGAAAHRLDAAEHLLRRETIRSSLVCDDDLGGPQLVAKVDEFIHLVQEGVVALALSPAPQGARRFCHSR